jgi:hypothetical protein
MTGLEGRLELGVVRIEEKWRSREHRLERAQIEATVANLPLCHRRREKALKCNVIRATGKDLPPFALSATPKRRLDPVPEPAPYSSRPNLAAPFQQLERSRNPNHSRSQPPTSPEICHEDPPRVETKGSLSDPPGHSRSEDRLAGGASHHELQPRPPGPSLGSAVGAPGHERRKTQRFRKERVLPRDWHER